MTWFTKQYKNQIEDACNDVGVSYNDILKCPRCYNNEFVAFQSPDYEVLGDGLKGHNHAKVLLMIRLRDNELYFEFAKDIKQMLN